MASTARKPPERQTTAGTRGPSAIGRRRQRRRAAHDEGQSFDTRAAIMSSVERLLATTPLHQLSVSAIVEDAGLSRLAFYSYFDSKYDAVGAVVSEVMDSMYELWSPFLGAPDDTDPVAALREVLISSYDLMWVQHGAIGRTIHDYWSSTPELGELWLEITDRFTTGIAAIIDQARATGAMPYGTDSRQIAAAGLWTSEQLIYVLHLGRSSDLPDFDSVLNLLTDLWRGLLFGGQQQPAG